MRFRSTGSEDQHRNMNLVDAPIGLDLEIFTLIW